MPSVNGGGDSGGFDRYGRGFGGGGGGQGGKDRRGSFRRDSNSHKPERRCSTCPNLLGPADQSQCGDCRVRGVLHGGPGQMALLQRGPGGQQGPQIPQFGAADALGIPMGGVAGGFEALMAQEAQVIQQRKESWEQVVREDQQRGRERQAQREREDREDEERYERRRRDREREGYFRDRSPRPEAGAGGYRQRSPIRQPPYPRGHDGGQRRSSVRVPCRQCIGAGYVPKAYSHYYHQCWFITAEEAEEARLQFEAEQTPQQTPQQQGANQERQPAAHQRTQATPTNANWRPIDSRAGQLLREEVERRRQTQGHSSMLPLEAAEAYLGEVRRQDTPDLIPIGDGAELLEGSEVVDWLNTYIASLKPSGSG